MAIEKKAFIFTYRGALVPLAFLPAMLIPAGPRPFWHDLAGTALVLLGLFFRIAGVRRIGGRARVHSAGARILLTGGIFGRVRNPLYIGNMLVAAGAAALFRSLLSAPFVLAFLLVLYTCVVLYEERALAAQMGAPFQEYLRRVPRWLVRLKPAVTSSPSDRPVPWGDVLKGERVFLAGSLGLCAAAPFRHLLENRLLPGEGPFPRAWRLAGAAAVLLVSAVLFLRVAARLKRKRGSWLAVERITGDPAPAGEPGKNR